MSTTLNRKIYERFTDSGLGQKAFPLQEGISVATLSYHLKRARPSHMALPPSFTELEVPVATGHMEITTPSDTVVRIPL